MRYILDNPSVIHTYPLTILSQYEGDEWNIAMAASNCLTKISPIVGNAILPHVRCFSL